MSEADKPDNQHTAKTHGAETPREPSAPGEAAAASPGAAPSAARDARRDAPAPRQASSGKGLALLALLVGLAGLGAGGYALLQQQKLATLEGQLDQRLGRFESLPERTRELAQRNEQLAARLQPLEQLPSAQTLQERGRLLADLQGQQQQLRERVEQVLGSSREQWRLAEAEYLIRMAMLRLSAMQDTESAIALLGEADLILRRQNDPGAYAARERLMEGLEALRSLPEIDRTGLFLQLGALQGRAGQLAALAPAFQLGEATGEQPEQPFWERWLAEAGRYVRIDLDSEAQVKPLLAGQSLAQVRLALSLAIEQAQWAVLNGNSEVYRQALGQAVSLLEQLFSEDNEQARALAERLRELMGREVAVELPELTPALRALQGYISEREQNGSLPAERSQEPSAAGEQPDAGAEPAPAAEGAST